MRDKFSLYLVSSPPCRKIDEGNRHLSARYFTSTTTRLDFPPEYSNCERQSRENTRRKFLAASLLEHIAGISMCYQHQRPGRTNSYLSVTPTPFPTFRHHPTASPPGLHSKSKIKYLREMVNTVTGVFLEVDKLEIGRISLRWGTRCVFHEMPFLLS